MEEVREVFRELNYPGASALKRVLKTRGIAFNKSEVDELVKNETVRQVQAPAYTFTGKIAAANLHSRIFCDLIDFTAAPSDGGKRVGLHPTEDNERYILVVQRVFDRKMFTAALTYKKPQMVAEAFQDILNRMEELPESCTTDMGAEFGEPFQTVLRRNGIDFHMRAKGDVNAIATVDVARGRLRTALARVACRRSTDDWADILAGSPSWTERYT